MATVNKLTMFLATVMTEVTEYDDFIKEIQNAFKTYFLGAVYAIAAIIGTVWFIMSWIQYGSAEEEGQKKQAKKRIIASGVALGGIMISYPLALALISLFQSIASNLPQ